MDVATTVEPTDDDLATRAGRRDRTAFHILVDRHARPLAASLLRQLPADDAEDVLDDVLLYAWRAANTYQGGNYRAWLFQIARSFLAKSEHARRGPVPESTATNAETASSHAVNVEQCLAGLDDRE